MRSPPEGRGRTSTPEAPPRSATAPAARATSAAARRAFGNTATPPIRSRGSAYSASTDSDASTRAASSSVLTPERLSRRLHASTSPTYRSSSSPWREESSTPRDAPPEWRIRPTATALRRGLVRRLRRGLGEAGGRRRLGGRRRSAAAWSDHHAALRVLALAVRGDPGVLRERGVDDPALRRGHRPEGDGPPGPAHPLRKPPRHFLQRFPPALPVALHIHDDRHPAAAAVSHDQVDQQVQGLQGLPPAPDQRRQFRPRHRHLNRASLFLGVHRRAEPHRLDQRDDGALGELRELPGRRGRRRGRPRARRASGGGLVLFHLREQRQSHARRAGPQPEDAAASFVQHHEIDVFPARAEDSEGLANRLFDGPAGPFSRLHARLAPFLPCGIGAGARPPPPDEAAAAACDLGGEADIGGGEPTTRKYSMMYARVDTIM